MKLFLAFISSAMLLALAAFCLLGFLASFKSTETTFVAFRIGYAVVGIGCVVGVAALIVMGVRK